MRCGKKAKGKRAAEEEKAGLFADFFAKLPQRKDGSLFQKTHAEKSRLVPGKKISIPFLHKIDYTVE